MPVLDWCKRLKIALGAAKGLAYLHEDCEYISVNSKSFTELNCFNVTETTYPLLTSYLVPSALFIGHPRIIHRDIKSANILLDDAFEAQVRADQFFLLISKPYVLFSCFHSLCFRF